MTLFRKLFHRLLLNREHAIVKLFAKIGYKLNSYHAFPARVPNLLSGATDSITVYNQFVPSQMRHPVDDLRVGRWAVSVGKIKNLNVVTSVELYGASENSEGFDFFFPLDLADQYPGFLAELGPPNEVMSGILNPSGRSIWLFPKGLQPICLKIDTMQLTQRRYFSERAMLPNGVRHAVLVSEYLQDVPIACEEDFGGNIIFDFAYSDGLPMRYTFLHRRYNFAKLGLRHDDFLLPVVSVLSPDLWMNRSLLESVELRGSPADFLRQGFARCFAELIRKCLTQTFLHFEVHQQNLSLHLREGQAVQLIYHDLQDTVFDPVTFFLQQVVSNGPEAIDNAFQIADRFEQSRFLNSHGQIIKVGASTREYYSVTSCYRRYLRNFGAYNKSLNYFSNPDSNDESYFSVKEFESRILESLSFKKADLETEEVRFHNDEERQFLTQNLFWNIDRFQRVLQKKLLMTFIKSVDVGSIRSVTLPPSALADLLRCSDPVGSNDFPSAIDQIRWDAVTQIQSMLHDRILLVTYLQKKFLIMRFQRVYPYQSSREGVPT